MDRLNTLRFEPSPSSPPEHSETSRFDPEMLYVECRLCGRPVNWGFGLSTLAVVGAGISENNLDARCMILTDGCEQCKPHSRHEHIVIRISGAGKYDRLQDEPAGYA